MATGTVAQRAHSLLVTDEMAMAATMSVLCSRTSCGDEC
jgi:hypothetical protein